MDGHDDLADLMVAFGKKSDALLSSSDLVLTVRGAMVAAPSPSPTSAAAAATPSSSSAAPSGAPPPPFQRCPWPRFVRLLTRSSANDLLARVVAARADAAAFFAFLCATSRRTTGAGVLRDALRDFLVYPEAATRRVMRELERAAME
jgi:hypothetical protein